MGSEYSADQIQILEGLEAAESARECISVVPP